MPASRNGSDKLEASLKAVGLNPEHVLDKFPHQLSGGQLQRFLIARALLLDVRFLVADEIISMLDASTRIDVLELAGGPQRRAACPSSSSRTTSRWLLYQRTGGDPLPRLRRGDGRGRTEYSTTRLHPYTRMLMASVPRLDKKWGEVEVELDSKRPATLGGCVYFERCSGADRDCATRPRLVEAEPDHLVACCRC